MESTIDNNLVFPPEILTEIFRYVDPHTLVFSCRHVCRMWRDTVECPAMWKIKIFQTQGHKFATDNALFKAHLNYPWYVCYALCRNVFNTNLFARRKGIPQFRRDAEVVWPQNERHLCICGGRTRNNCVDLYAQGLTRKLMEFQPPIRIINVFYYNVDCHIDVKLYDSEWRCCSEHGYFTSHKQTEWRKWYKVSHTFRNYSPDVRYVVFLHGIGTVSEDFLNICYSMIGETSVFVGIPEASEPSDSSSSDSRLRVPLPSFVNTMRDSCI